VVHLSRARVAGNSLHGTGDFAAALLEYQRGLDALDTAAEADIASVDRLRVTLLVNAAACHLKLQAWGDAVRDCTRVLAQDTNHFKALWRRAQAYKHQRNFSACEADLLTALRSLKTMSLASGMA
jgi:hypothetical protein